MIWLVSSRTK